MKNRGFTLIEIMTAITVFAAVMTISMGSILGVFDTNRKSEALKTVMDNLNLSLESMSREIRFGTDYYCGVSVPHPPGEARDCDTGGDSITFRASDGSTIVYRLDAGGTGIEKKIDDEPYLPVTASEISIDDLSFFILGTGTEAPEQQPKVLIKIKGTAGSKAIAETDFTVQTLVSQRRLDN